MRTLDTEYINDLTERVKDGSVDAFSELFGTTYEKQYSYAYHILKKRRLAKRALHLTYLRAYRDIYTLSRADVFPSWLFLINFDVCMSIRGRSNIDSTYIKVGNKEYSISNIRKLPLTEACVVLDKFYLKIPSYWIADFLEISRGTVKENVILAKEHLGKLLQEDKRHIKRDLWSSHIGNPKLNIDEATDILKGILREVLEVDVSDISSELLKNAQKEITKEISDGEMARNTDTSSLERTKDLLSYSIFRKESVGLRAGFLTGFTILFFLVPVLFVSPRIAISDGGVGKRGLLEYTVRVKGMLPVRKVEAVLHGKKIPVYEVSPHTYTIEPPGDGEMTLYVELFNGQRLLDSVEVENTDYQPPVFISAEKSDGYIFFYVKDDGVGMNFADSYAVLESGETVKSDYYDSTYNYIAFPEFEGKAELVFLDNFQNVLHILY